MFNDWDYMLTMRRLKQIAAEGDKWRIPIPFHFALEAHTDAHVLGKDEAASSNLAGGSIVDCIAPGVMVEYTSRARGVTVVGRISSSTPFSEKAG